jgi:hypothetical protein
MSFVGYYYIRLSDSALRIRAVEGGIYLRTVTSQCNETMIAIPTVRSATKVQVLSKYSNVYCTVCQ